MHQAPALIPHHVPCVISTPACKLKWFFVPRQNLNEIAYIPERSLGAVSTLARYNTVYLIVPIAVML